MSLLGENSVHLADWSYASLAASTHVLGKDGSRRSALVNSFCDNPRHNCSCLLVARAALARRSFSYVAFWAHCGH